MQNSHFCCLLLFPSFVIFKKILIWSFLSYFGGKINLFTKASNTFWGTPEHLFFKKVKNSSKFWQTQDLSRNSRLNSWIHAIQNQSLFLLFGLADTRRHDLLFRSVIFQFSVLCNEDGAITTDSIFLGKTLFWYFNFFNSLTWLDFEKIECNVMGDQWLVLKCC